MAHRIRTILAGASMAVLLVGTAGAAEPTSKAEAAALAVRHLQTEFMVAALTCGYHDQYNRAAEFHSSELARHGGVLKRMFNDRYGRAGQRELDRYVTQLANDISLRSIRARGTFCRDAAMTFQAALDGGATLEQLSESVVQEAVAAGESAR